MTKYFALRSALLLPGLLIGLASIASAACLTPSSADYSAILQAASDTSYVHKAANPGLAYAEHQYANAELRREINHSIDAQLAHVHCVASLQKSGPVVASVNLDGSVRLGRTVGTVQQQLAYQQR